MKRTLADRLGDPQFRLAVLTLVVLLAQAVIATSALEVELDWFSQFAPLLVYATFVGSHRRSRAAELLFGAAIVLGSLAVLTLYARL
jgi:hypothetical protein